MSLAHRTISAIQIAGEKLYASRVAVEADLARYGEEFLSLTKSQPFSIDATRSFERLRGLSQLSQELAALEENLRSVFSKATAFDNDGQGAPGRTLVFDKSSAVDAVVRAALPYTPVAKRKITKHTKKAKRNNRDLVLSFLQQNLSNTVARKLTHQQIASGANVPSGSISAILKRIILEGEVIDGEDGYRLKG